MEGVLAAVAGALRGPLLMAGADSGPMLQALTVVGRMDVRWPDRWRVLREYILGAAPLLLVLDNFEDNLTDRPDAGGLRAVTDDGLAGLLDQWARDPGRSRLLVTCRYPIGLPGMGRRRCWTVNSARSPKRRR